MSPEEALDRHEKAAIKNVTARMSASFPEFSTAAVDETVERAYHRFDRSRVRTFVPVLVEHAVRDELADRKQRASR